MQAGGVPARTHAPVSCRAPLECHIDPPLECHLDAPLESSSVTTLAIDLATAAIQHDVQAIYLASWHRCSVATSRRVLKRRWTHNAW